MSDLLSFDGKVVVVTGAGNGVGRSHALEFARRGAKVVVNDLGGATDGTGSDTAAASIVVEEIKRLGGEAAANFDSVATPEGGESIINTAISNFGRVDAVVSNAGILRDKSFAKLTVAELDAIIDVHLRGTFFVLQPAFKWMKDNGGGNLIATTSASGLFGNFGQSNYAAAKLGVVGMVRVLALEGARAGIKVNAISPIAATRLAGDMGGGTGMDPSRVTPMAIVLAHESCPVSGEVYLAGGGWFARSYVACTEGINIEGDRVPTAEELLERFSDIRSSPSVELADAMGTMALMQPGS
ncbi:MAG: SDR family NAD(P)-dependent oxidoreductase [Acidimicrobiia bacterium]